VIKKILLALFCALGLMGQVASAASADAKAGNDGSEKQLNAHRKNFAHLSLSVLAESYFKNTFAKTLAQGGEMSGPQKLINAYPYNGGVYVHIEIDTNNVPDWDVIISDEHEYNAFLATIQTIYFGSLCSSTSGQYLVERGMQLLIIFTDAHGNGVGFINVVDGKCPSL